MGPSEQGLCWSLEAIVGTLKSLHVKVFPVYSSFFLSFLPIILNSYFFFSFSFIMSCQVPCLNLRSLLKILKPHRCFLSPPPNIESLKVGRNKHRYMNKNLFRYWDIQIYLYHECAFVLINPNLSHLLPKFCQWPPINCLPQFPYVGKYLSFTHHFPETVNRFNNLNSSVKKEIYI